MMKHLNNSCREREKDLNTLSIEADGKSQSLLLYSPDRKSLTVSNSTVYNAKNQEFNCLR
jgi:hypothetical protein